MRVILQTEAGWIPELIEEKRGTKRKAGSPDPVLAVDDWGKPSKLIKLENGWWWGVI